MSWKKVKLREVCKSISDGDHQPPPKATSGIPFVTIANIKDNKFDFTNTMFVSREYYEKLDSKRKAQEGDILYSVVGSFGIPVYIDNECEFVFQRHIAILRPNKEKILPEFLYYTMLSRDFYMRADAVALGAAQRTVSLTSLRAMEIELPPIRIQENIVKALKPYDQLIENNKKQIKLLEEAAERLYREWFVDLHFPRYENTEIIDGVPEGWKRKRLVDIADIQYGYAFDGSKFNDMKKGIPIVRIRNIPAGITSDYTTEETEEKYLIGNGDIIVGMDGEFHINSWSGDNAYLVQRTCCFRPKKKEMQGWLLWAIRKPIKYYEKTIVGATVSHLGKKHIDAIDLLVGPDELYVPFQNYFDKRQSLLNQNVLLLEARDRLLPRLMSGEVEV